MVYVRVEPDLKGVNFLRNAFIYLAKFDGCRIISTFYYLVASANKSHQYLSNRTFVSCAYIV